MLNFYWIWVSVPNLPLVSLDSLTFVSCSALLFTVLSYPLLIFVALSFFYLSVSLSLLLSFFCPLPHCPFTCQQSASIFIPPYHPSAQLRPLCLYLDSTVLSFFLQTINLYWQWPPSHTSAIKAFPVFIDTVSQKMSIKGPCENRKSSWFFLSEQRGEG